MNKEKKTRSKVSYLEHVTYWGRCSEKTKAGDDCRNHVLFANGRCASHGGTTPKNRRDWTKEARDTFDAMKARLIARADRLSRKIEKKKWALDKSRKADTKAGTASLKATGPMVEFAKPQPAQPALRADHAASSNAVTAAYCADSTRALPPAREPNSASSSPTVISPALEQPRERPSPSATSSEPTNRDSLKRDSEGKRQNASESSALTITRSSTAELAKEQGKPETAVAPKGERSSGARANDSEPKPAPPSVIPWDVYLRRLIAESRRSMADDYIAPGTRLEPKTHPD